MTDYNKKLERERQWYVDQSFQEGHVLNKWPFYSHDRNAFNYIFPRSQLANYISSVIKSNKLTNPKILIAPSGICEELQYIKHLSNNITCIDISPDAIDKIKDDSVIKYVGDIKQMDMLQDNSFDIILISLFFHHYLAFNFDDFLKEAHRVLKPGGHLFSLEPSSLYPMCLLSQGLKKLVGNITGAVADEAPFVPSILLNSLKNCGFRNIKVCGASFSHNRFPKVIAKVTNIITYPFLKCPLVKHFAWLCIFYGKK